MTLQRRFIFWSVILMLGVATLGLVSVWNLIGFRQTITTIQHEYAADDHAGAAIVHVTWLREALLGPDAATYVDVTAFRPIQSEVDLLVARLNDPSGYDDGDATTEHDLARSLHDTLTTALQRCTNPADKPAVAKATAADLGVMQRDLQLISKLAPAAARRHVAAVDARITARMWWTSVVLGVVLILAIVVFYRQHLTLVVPLLHLRDNIRRAARQQFREEVLARGDPEFREMALAFNGLAKELTGLYQSMEEKIVQRSRELVRSERLASVGFLAAGVAHEINNPLSIISGYAELAAKSLKNLVLEGEDHATAAAKAEAEAEALVSALDAQELIREEAFRCKEITARLLSLARGGESGRQVVRMDETARQVAILVKGLKNYRDRRVVVDFDVMTPLEVHANSSEMKQVLLNLTINALEAAPGGRGEVRITGHRVGEWVEVTVADNGRGMTAETLQHVFEPFFTAKRGAGEPGTGLGLSITHAIVDNHGGRITADSEGQGRGSRFTIQLPAYFAAEKQLVNSAR